MAHSERNHSPKINVEFQVASAFAIAECVPPHLANELDDENTSMFVGLFSKPGVEMDFARDPDGNIKLYPTSELATMGGCFSLLNTMNADRRNARRGKQETYRKITGNEFAVLLGQTGLTATFFAEIYGTSTKRVMWWIQGVNDDGKEEHVPHPAFVLLRMILADPKNIDIAQAATAEVTTSRRKSA